MACDHRMSNSSDDDTGGSTTYSYRLVATIEIRRLKIKTCMLGPLRCLGAFKNKNHFRFPSPRRISRYHQETQWRFISVTATLGKMLTTRSLVMEVHAGSSAWIFSSFAFHEKLPGFQCSSTVSVWISCSPFWKYFARVENFKRRERRPIFSKVSLSIPWK